MASRAQENPDTSRAVGRPDKYTPEQVIDAINKAGGIKGMACKALGTDYKTLNRYIEKYEAVRDAYEDANQMQCDVSYATILLVRDGKMIHPVSGEVVPDPFTNPKVRAEYAYRHLMIKGGWNTPAEPEDAGTPMVWSLAPGQPASPADLAGQVEVVHVIEESSGDASE